MYTLGTFHSQNMSAALTGATYKSVTQKPTGWFKSSQDADIVLDLNDFGKANPGLFNHPMKVASDGEKLVLADSSNNRVLIWNSIPLENNQVPDLVIGQPDLYSSEPGIAADKLNWPVGVATDGKRLLVADTENNRILIWNEFPTQNGKPADLVLGAENFTTRGGVPDPPPENWEKKYFRWPWDVFTDGTRVIISGTGTGNVLIWNTFPTKNCQSADVILTEKVGLGTPRCAYYDGQHLIVGDYNASKTFVWNELPKSDNVPYGFTLWQEENEFAWAVSANGGKFMALTGDVIAIWNKFPTSETDAADVLFGKVDMGIQHNPTSATAASFEAGHAGMAATEDYLFISSGYTQNRVLIYYGIPDSNIALADVVLGAPDFETNTLTEYYIPHMGAVYSNGEHLFINHHTGLYVWKELPDESTAKPDIVYSGHAGRGITGYNGKLIATHNVGTDIKVMIWNGLPLNGELPDIELGPNFDNGMQFIYADGVAADDNYLFVSDSKQDKIFIWEGGVPDTVRSPDFAIDAADPCQVSSDGEHLAVACMGNHSISIWNLPLDKDNLSPNLELKTMEKDGVEIRFNLPQGVFVDGKRLFVADTSFHRVLVWNQIPISNETPPNVVLGQDTFDLQQAYPHTSRAGLFLPGNICFDGSYLWVGEFKFSDRVLRYSAPTLQMYVDPAGSCGGKTPCCITIQSAINAASTGCVISIANGRYTESITLDEAKAVTLQGGWDTAFTSQTGMTSLQNAPKAQQGYLTLQNLTIKPE